MLACLNLPPEVGMKPESIYIQAIIPGPKEPNGEQLNTLLRPLAEKLKELLEGKITGFISHSGSRFSRFCTIHKDHIEDIETDIWPSRRLRSCKRYVASWLNFSTATERASFFKEKGVRYSILEDLPYWDATKMVSLDIMHSLLLGVVKDHALFKLCIPESKWKHKRNNSEELEMFENDSTDSDDIQKVIISRKEWRALKNDAQTPRNQLKAQESSIRNIKSSDNIGFSSLTEPCHDDPEFIPISSETNVEGFYLSFHSYRAFNHENIKELGQIVEQTTIPSFWTRVPKNVGSAKHGNLKAAEWELLYKVYLPLFFLVSQLYGKEISLGIMNNTFLLISCLNIAMSANLTQKKVGDWTILWSKF
ncbi:hypothetical protein O181_028584 [Austropuccinia psidii MF-1]|uniref:Uncharacterized protein n=1 Tax=Austropuccinia psidii MF-1 TaxID=1389203 RepID=A0A9Q3CQY0_9BASI|nr:hypothetical protein [Austropuccinia psidii MF-1]